MQEALRKKGVSVIDGGYLTGKTTMAVGLVKAMLLVAQSIKEAKE